MTTPSPTPTRSSATAEDLPDASFAGQQETPYPGGTTNPGIKIRCRPPPVR